MAAQADPSWATRFHEAFASQDASRSRAQIPRDYWQELQREKRRRRKLEKSFSWRVTAPGRKFAAKAKKRSKKSPHKPGQGSLATNETLQKRQDAIVRRTDRTLNQLGLQQSDRADFEAALAALSSALDAARQDRELLWFAYLAVVGRYPDENDLLLLESDLHAFGSRHAISGLLSANAYRRNAWSLYADIEFVSCPIVDVTSTATIDTHTGIQRVVRETVSRWLAWKSVELVAWDERGMAFRSLTTTEQARIIDFTPGVEREPVETPQSDESTLIAPFRTVLVVPEHSADMGRSLAIGAIGRYSDTEVVGMFYDFIDRTLPETLSERLRVRLSNFVPALRTFRRVSAISETAGLEIRAFGETLPGLGMPVPSVRTHLLPTVGTQTTGQVLHPEIAALTSFSSGPLVTSVSRIEPRKNQITTLRAAESLWAEGLDFQLLFIGWNESKISDFSAELKRLQDLGRPVALVAQATEPLLWSAYRESRFTVFLSLAEGYGLPAAESISVGTPALLSNFGSVAEIGAQGGAVLVDPRNFLAVRTAMRELLVDDARVAELETQARARDFGNWEQYATQTWEWLVEGAE